VEIDNYGVTRQPEKAGAGGIWVWGYDEITCSRTRAKAYRAECCAYAWLGPEDGPKTVTSDARQPDVRSPAGTAGGGTTLMCRAEPSPTGWATRRRSGPSGRPTRAAGNGIGHEDAAGSLREDLRGRFEEQVRAAHWSPPVHWTMKTVTILLRVDG